MPKDLKRRLEREAKYQDVSINQLTNYLLNSRLTQLEPVSILGSRLSNKTVNDLKKKARKIMSKVPSREVLNWARIN